MLVRKPSRVRMYESTSTSARLGATSRYQLPVPLPTPPLAMPLATLPRSRSRELKCLVCQGAKSKGLESSLRIPVSSTAVIATSAVCSEWLVTLTNPC